MDSKYVLPGNWWYGLPCLPRKMSLTVQLSGGCIKDDTFADSGSSLEGEELSEESLDGDVLATTLRVVTTLCLERVTTSFGEISTLKGIIDVSNAGRFGHSIVDAGPVSASLW